MDSATYLMIMMMIMTIKPTIGMVVVHPYDIQNIDEINLLHTFKTPFILKMWAIIEIMVYLLMRYHYI
jgi:hypothetical protein